MEPAETGALVTQKFAEHVDEITKIEDLMEIGDWMRITETSPDKGKVLGDWMAWMVHRVHLNDPSLTELDFANVEMPPGHAEPRIAPKLAKALAHNTHLVTLELSRTSLQNPEGQLLAESLKVNEALQFLSVEKSSLDSHTIKLMAEALSENSHSVLEVWRFSRQKNMGSRFFRRPVEEAVADLMDNNQRIYELGLGFSCRDDNLRMKIERAILRNTDFDRKRKRCGADGVGDDEVTAEHKQMSRLILRDAPAKLAAEVFGDGRGTGLVRQYIAENGVFPGHGPLRSWAKRTQAQVFTSKEVNPLLEDFYTKLLNATIECQVSVQDMYGDEFSGSLRAWAGELLGSWSLDLWPSSDRRLNFTSHKQPTIEISCSFKDWLRLPVES